MTASIATVLIDSDSHVRKELVEIIGKFGGNVGLLAATADFEEGMRRIRDSHPQIVILEVNDVEQGAMETSLVLSHSPGTAVFVTCPDKNPDWILRLIRAGASEYLTRPVVAAELVEAVNKVARQHARSIGEIPRKGRAITVYNPSAGMGTTTIAVNLAASLARQGEKVALIDLNLFSGDVATFLNLTPRYTLASVTGNLERADARFLASVVVPHPSGMHVLGGPTDISEAGLITPEQVQQVIDVCQSLYAYTIIDTGGSLYGCNQAVFARSDQVLYTTVLTLPALKNAKRYLQAMGSHVGGAGRVKLVLNRQGSKDDIRVADAEKVLQTRAYVTVPNAYEDVQKSINKGEPLVSCIPKSPVARAIQELARQLTQNPVIKAR